jgi:DNA repair protein RecN (Recombination protein N)
VDLLRYQIGEIEAAEISEDDETLAERHAAAAHAEEIVENANAVTEALGGDEGASAMLAAVVPRMNAMARHLPQASEWVGEAEEIAVRLQELSRAVADAAAGLDGGEEDLAALDARLAVVNRLKRKYLPGGGGVAALADVLESKRRKLEEMETRDERIAALKAELATSLKALKKAGAALTKARRAAAAGLADAVTAELRGLGFRQSDFSVSIEQAEPLPHGCDRVVFMFAPNPGEAARPLADIASSGEIARVLLALVSATLSRTPASVGAPTLVFDEIDANIGGEVGRAVGERLRAVAAGRQAIALTHLPQTAAYGNRHLVVEKKVSGGRTRTRISAADGDGRVSEIARMLGGEKITSVVRKHAQELLKLSC